jgi:hypothetical protein
MSLRLSEILNKITTFTMSAAGVIPATVAQSTPYPTLESLRSAQVGVRHLPNQQRFFWPLSGSLDTVVAIMPDRHNPDRVEPYYSNHGTRHALAHTPLTEPKVSAITVKVDALAMWEDHWLELHRNHSDPNDSGAGASDSGAEWGILPDHGEEDDEEGEVHLLRCCGEPRPRKKSISVVVRPAAGGEGFVTVHDYLSVVHPWLMGLRGEILRAMSSALSASLSPATELMVNCDALDDLMIELKTDWMRLCRTVPLPPMERGANPWRPFAETAAGRMPPLAPPPERGDNPWRPFSETAAGRMPPLAPPERGNNSRRP